MFSKRSLSRILFGVYLFPLLLVVTSLSVPPADLPLCGLMFGLAVVGSFMSRHDSRIWRIIWVGALTASILFGVLEVVAGYRIAHRRSHSESATVLQYCAAITPSNTALQPTATALAVLRMSWSRLMACSFRWHHHGRRGRGSALDR